MTVSHRAGALVTADRVVRVADGAVSATGPARPTGPSAGDAPDPVPAGGILDPVPAGGTPDPVTKEG